MSANRSILALPTQKQSFNDRIHRFLASLQPYAAEHAQLGQRTFEEGIFGLDNETAINRNLYVHTISRDELDTDAMHAATVSSPEGSDQKWAIKTTGIERLTEEEAVQGLGWERRSPIRKHGRSSESMEDWKQTESAQRRLQRKLRRREKAAIMKPAFIDLPLTRTSNAQHLISGSPQISRRKKEDSIAKPAMINLPLPRPSNTPYQKLVVLPALYDGVQYSSHEPMSNSVGGHTKKVRSGAGVFQSRGIYTGDGRMTNRPFSKQGFLGYGKASQPIQLPSSKVKLQPPRVFSEDEFLNGSQQRHPPPITEFKETIDWRAKRLPVIRTEPRPTLTAPHTAIQQAYGGEDRARLPAPHEGDRYLDYRRLQPPGRTNSSSWPTDLSEKPAPIFPGRLADPPRTFLHESNPGQASYGRDSRMGQEEVEGIMSAGTWRWPPDHPLRPTEDYTCSRSPFGQTAVNELPAIINHYLSPPATRQQSSVQAPQLPSTPSNAMLPPTMTFRFTPQPMRLSSTHSNEALSWRPRQQFDLDQVFWTAGMQPNASGGHKDSQTSEQIGGDVTFHADRYDQPADAYRDFTRQPGALDHVAEQSESRNQIYGTVMNDIAHTLSFGIPSIDMGRYDKGPSPYYAAWDTQGIPHGQPEMPANVVDMDEAREVDQYGATEQDWRRLWQGGTL